MVVFIVLVVEVMNRSLGSLFLIHWSLCGHCIDLMLVWWQGGCM